MSAGRTEPLSCPLQQCKRSAAPARVLPMHAPMVIAPAAAGFRLGPTHRDRQRKRRETLWIA